MKKPCCESLYLREKKPTKRRRPTLLKADLSNISQILELQQRNIAEKTAFCTQQQMPLSRAEARLLSLHLYPLNILASRAQLFRLLGIVDTWPSSPASMPPKRLLWVTAH